MSDVYIVNPLAGRGRGALVARELPGRLAQRGLSGDIAVTSAPREAVCLAREAAAHASLVVAVGGDGTANEVVNGLAETDTVFGLLPVGSGNDLAMALGVPTNLDRALDVIADGYDAAIDLGRFDDRWFANSLGIGFEAEVTIEARKVKRLRGFAVSTAEQN